MGYNTHTHTHTHRHTVADIEIIKWRRWLHVVDIVVAVKCGDC